jgi:hypothetical protein
MRRYVYSPGGIYPRVPTAFLTVKCVLPLGSSGASNTSPKSATFAWSSSLSSTFFDATSRWNSGGSCECRCASARTTPTAMCTRACQVSGGRADAPGRHASRWSSGPPAHTSSTRHLCGPSDAKAYRLQRLGCETEQHVFISTAKRCALPASMAPTAPPSPCAVSSSFLTTTRMPNSRPLYTRQLPPSLPAITHSSLKPSVAPRTSENGSSRTLPASAARHCNTHMRRACVLHGEPLPAAKSGAKPGELRSAASSDCACARSEHTPPLAMAAPSAPPPSSAASSRVFHSSAPCSSWYTCLRRRFRARA